MLCARVLRGHHEGEKRPNIVLRIFEALFNGMLKAYEWTLDKVLAWRLVTLMITFATIAGTVWLYITVPKGFFPIEDTGFIIVVTEGATDSSFAAMVDRQRQVSSIVRADKAVAYANSTVGAGGPNPTTNYGRMFVALKPKKERQESSTAVIQRLRRSTAAVPGMKTSFQNLQNINVGARISKAEYQYTLQSSDTEALYRIAPELAHKLSQLPMLWGVDTDLYIKNPQMSVEVDREQIAVYGITVEQVRQQLFSAYGNRQVGTIYTPSNDYQIILEADPKLQSDTSDLSRLYLKTAGGQSIPLSAVARLVPSVGPLQVNHQGQQPAVTISFNLTPGHSLGEAVDAIQKVERESNLPATVVSGFSGTAQIFQDSLKGQGILILAAIFAAYVVLGILYESFIHPITIISGLPSAGIGAILTLMAFKMELTVIAMIGIVMLVGIVKKNAIMMVDFAIERRRVGVGAEAAIREACLLRFRPIMMTTFAAIFGALPIALGAGAGAELRQPLGIAVVGGLCLSQLLTLYITPVIYTYLDGFDRLLKRRLDPPKDDLPEEAEPAEPRPVAAE